MKELFKKIIIKIMTIESKLVLKRFKPGVIAIVGSVGKTSTKDAVFAGLKNFVHVRKNQKSFNSEIGTPLTILGLQNAWNSPWLWILNCIKGFLVLFKFKYPDWLVLEVGIDQPGDMDNIAKWLKPNIVVITSLPKIPVHVEFFETPEDYMEEEKKILKYIKFDGVLILNADDPHVFALKGEMQSRVKNIFTFGISEASDVSVSNADIIYENGKVKGVNFKANYEGNSIPITILNTLGLQQIYPVTASLCAGLALDVPLIKIAEGIKEHRAPKGRMNIIDAVNNSVLLDDSYNASPTSMEKAVSVLASIENTGPKIAVLGDMLELGRFTAKEHKRVGQFVFENKIDYLVSVGLRSKDMSSQARESGMSESKVFHFDKSEQAIEKVKELIKEDSVILVKGSQGVRMEKISAAILTDPAKREELLVRQEKEWEKR